MREAQSLQSLMILISRCIEVLNLWKIACDHQFEVVTKDLTGPQKATLKDSTLKQLLKPDNEEVIDLYYIIFLSKNAFHDLDIGIEVLYSLHPTGYKIALPVLYCMRFDATILLQQQIILLVLFV